jgi:probable rRNA maturation factor
MAKKEIRLPSARTLSRFLSMAQQAVRLKGQVTVLLTTDAAIAKLNRQFRGKNKATDVLSFPAQGVGAEGIAGDVAISVTTAMGQAAEQGHSLSTEIKVLILHGLLHLAGYDHEAGDGKMARRERLLRGRLGLPQGLIERAGARKQGEKKHPSGAKAQVRIAPFAARLKSCPFKAESRICNKKQDCRFNKTRRRHGVLRTPTHRTKTKKSDGWGTVSLSVGRQRRWGTRACKPRAKGRRP